MNNLMMQKKNNAYNLKQTINTSSFLPAVFSIIVIGLMNWMASLISWLICVFVAVTSIAITGILWWTYYDIRHQQDSAVKWSILEEFVRNETAVYALAIIATIVMVGTANADLTLYVRYISEGFFVFRSA